MAVRNFYIDADIDGRKTPLTGGPRNKEGGFTLNLTIRKEGSITKGIVITGEEVDGKLRLWLDLGRDLEWIGHPLAPEPFPFQLPFEIRGECDR